MRLVGKFTCYLQILVMKKAHPLNLIEKKVKLTSPHLKTDSYSSKVLKSTQQEEKARFNFERRNLRPQKKVKQFRFQANSNSNLSKHDFSRFLNLLIEIIEISDEGILRMPYFSNELKCVKVANEYHLLKFKMFQLLEDFDAFSYLQEIDEPSKSSNASHYSAYSSTTNRIQAKKHKAEEELIPSKNSHLIQAYHEIQRKCQSLTIIKKQFEKTLQEEEETKTKLYLKIASMNEKKQKLINALDKLDVIIYENKIEMKSLHRQNEELNSIIKAKALQNEQMIQVIENLEEKIQANKITYEKAIMNAAHIETDSSSTIRKKKLRINSSAFSIQIPPKSNQSSKMPINTPQSPELIRSLEINPSIQNQIEMEKQMKKEIEEMHDILVAYKQIREDEMVYKRALQAKIDELTLELSFRKESRKRLSSMNDMYARYL